MSMPNLGVEISSNLKWNNHINKLAAKGNRSLGFIKRNLHSCTTDIKNLAYQSLVRQTLEYSSSVWDPHTQEQIYKIEAVQRRAARFVKHDYDRFNSVTDMLKNLNWSDLATRRKVNRLSIFQKAYYGQLSIPVQTLLHPVTRSTRRNHSKSFIEVQTSRDSYKYSFLPRTVTDWNNLPENIVNLQNHSKTK